MCKVNFVTQFDLIMEYCKEYDIPSRERMLWLALFQCANRIARSCNNFDWPDGYFTAGNNEINLWSGLDKRSIETIRNSLKQRGVIDFIKGNGKKSNPKYKINYLRREGFSIIPGNGSGEKTVNRCKFAPDTVPNHAPDTVPDYVPDVVPDYVPDDVPEYVPDYVSEKPVSSYSNINSNVNTNTNVNTNANTTADSCRARGGGIVLSDQEADELMRINEERNATYEAARISGFATDQATMRMIDQFCVEYGDRMVQECIKECVMNGVKKPVYLEKVLKNKRAGKPKPSPASSAVVKTVPAQQYEQREYEASTGLPDWMLAQLERNKRTEEATRA